MNHFSFEMSLIAILPALVLCGYVFYKDRVEKEPVGLLAILFGAGALSFIPSVFIEHIILKYLDTAFGVLKSISAEGIVTFTSAKTKAAYLALCAFLGFSVIRILLQWLVVFLITFKNKNFNYLFDGVVYSVFVSLGFTVSENIRFLLQNDTELLLPKLISSVPYGLLSGIIMGYFYTMWHMRFAANKIENKLLKSGAVEKDNIKSSALWFVASIFVPVLISGLYCLSGIVTNEIVLMLFYTSVFFVFSFSFLSVNSIAAKDESYGKYLYRIIAKGHPELTSLEIEEALSKELSEPQGEESQ